MSRRKAQVIDPKRSRKPGLRSKIFIREDMIGAGKIDLLRIVDEEGSISAAARRMGIGYRRAWFLIETVQRCFETPLVVKTRGGSSQGGAQITDFGKELIRQYQEFEDESRIRAKPFLDWLEKHQAPEKETDNGDAPLS